MQLEFKNHPFRTLSDHGIFDMIFSIIIVGFITTGVIVFSLLFSIYFGQYCILLGICTFIICFVILLNVLLLRNLIALNDDPIFIFFRSLKRITITEDKMIFRKYYKTISTSHDIMCTYYHKYNKISILTKKRNYEFNYIEDSIIEFFKTNGVKVIEKGERK